jgi:uncharacterized membrane protein YbaN (DUF454 family)
VWESASDRFREVLQSEQRSGNVMDSWSARMSATQTLALLAFAFLSAESIWHLLFLRD